MNKLSSKLITILCLIISVTFSNIHFAGIVKAELSFPWPKDESRQWFPRDPSNGDPAWHDTKRDNSESAIDMGTMNNSGANRYIVAAENGKIVFDCPATKTQSFKIQHGNHIVGYFHLDITELEKPSLKKNDEVKKGQLLGKTIFGEFNDFNCGKSPQKLATTHLHIPINITAPSITFDGWNLTYPNLFMTKGTETKNVGSNFTSTNTMWIRDNVIDKAKVYETKTEIRIGGDDKDVIIKAPADGGSITFKVN